MVYKMTPLERETRAIKYIARTMYQHGLYIYWRNEGDKVVLIDICFPQSVFDLPFFVNSYVKLPWFFQKLEVIIGSAVFNALGGLLVRRRLKSLLVSTCITAMKRYPRAMSMVIREFSKFLENNKEYEKNKKISKQG